MEGTAPPRAAYRAAMVLSGAGDALGYRNQRWEYCPSGPQIHAELAQLGGLGGIQAALPDWPVSDDTVLHLATAEALATGLEGEPLLQELARGYVAAMGDMEGRKPGPTSILGTSQLRPGEPAGYRIPFNPNATGCGAAMRSMAIGLRYPRPTELPTLIRISVESGRMTHHHPTGYLGALASALFTAYAVRGLPLAQWGAGLLQTLPLAQGGGQERGARPGVGSAAWSHPCPRRYLAERGLAERHGPPRFPPRYGPAERDGIYQTFSLEGWAGRSGHDAPMIAYDALLGSGDRWDELCSRAMFHGGDSDSTGVIAGCCWGLAYGLAGVPEGNHRHLEYRQRMEAAADRIHALAWGESAP
ncbi:ADP-ribosylhydrolase ARH1-like [Lepidochelys kempii]|uniref:ADP-ribosylhydrolase ARH1-like n=1 Tax=Lepidochelys kempii TaxID=8472 RepID=UPI003C704755